MSRPAAVEITAEGLDRIPGSHVGDVFEVKLFTPTAGGEVAHVLDEHGSTWSLGVGDWRPAPNALELPASIDRRIELRSDGIDVRTSTADEGFLVVSLRLELAEVGYVSISGSVSELRSILARCLSTVNAVGRAVAELEPDAD